MALFAFFIHRHLQHRDGIKADFSAQAAAHNSDKPSRTTGSSHYYNDEEQYYCNDEQQAMGVGSRYRKEEKDVDMEHMSGYGRLADKVDKYCSNVGHSNE